MGGTYQFDDDRQREIYEYVERNGAVWPEMVRQNVLVRPESNSKPTRSGAQLEPSVKMPSEEVSRHVSVLKRDGYLEEHNGKLRVAMPVDVGARTVPLDEGRAVVRPARQEDVDGIVDVIETIAADEGYVVAARLAEKVDRDGVLLRHNEREDRVFFVATVEDEAVGWLHVEGTLFDRMDHTAALTLGVLEAYRGDGIGSTLVESGLDWARDRGYRKVYQNLSATNDDAVAFLEEHGWSVESTREGHYRIGGELVDEIQLACWLEGD